MTEKNKKSFHYFIQLCLLLSLYTDFVHAQIERWIYQYNGLGNSTDEAYSIVYGVDGNIYAAGYSYESGTYQDFTIISLTPMGIERWVYTYNGSGNSSDFAHSIVYGLDGNIYAAGRSISSINNDLIVISLTSSGDERWIYTYNGSGNGFDQANSLVYGADSNIYIAGGSYGSSNNMDFVVISLTPSGDERWVYRYNGPDNNYDEAKSLVYGADNNIYVAGQITVTILGAPYGCFTVIKLSTEGTIGWNQGYWSGGYLGSIAYSIDYSLDDNIYAAGIMGYSGNADFSIMSFDTAGNREWDYAYNGPGNSHDAASSIVCGLDDNVYVAGHIESSSTGYDFTVINLTNVGGLNWIYVYNGPGNGHDVASSIVYAANENIYAAGWSLGLDSDNDFTVINLDTSGTEKWIYAYNGPGNDYDRANSIAYGSDDNIYAAGYSFGISTHKDFTVISLDTTASYIEEQTIITESVEEFALLPALFNEKVSIRFASPSNSTLKIIFYDVLGKVVYETSFPSTPSFLELNDPPISKLPKGVYFVSISIEDKAFPAAKLIKP